MKRSYSDLDQHTGDPPFAFGPAARGPRQPKQYQQQTEPGTGKIKACMQCGTTRTPQWREGPYGPKTLCNACGVKRVRAIKAQQQGKNPTQVPHTSSTGAKKKSAAAARTESIELATTLQLLAGNLDAGPPPAKRQARAGQVGPGRGRKANSMQAAANHVPEYDPFDPAAAAAMSAPALGSAVQKAIAAIAAKGSMGGESNPTDSGEEISWSPNDHTAPGDAAAAAAGEGAGSRRQRQQQQQLRAAMAAAAAAQLAATGAGDQEDLMHLAGLQGQPLSQVHQMEAGLAEGYGAATAEAGHDGAGAAVDEEAAAVANLLSMSAAASDQQQNSGPRPTSSAGKAAMREFVAQLAAGSGPSTTPASKSPARRQTTRTPPPRHVVTVRQRGAAAGAAGAEPLVEEDVLYLLGPGMAVMARYVAPEELLEVIKLNEMASEAQRSKAAAEAAVEAVEQILRDKQAAAMAAQATARTAMQRLHSYVGELNAEHSLMLKAAQEQQPAALASRLAGSSAVGSLTQLDILAASLQQQQQMQDMQASAGAELADQQQQHAMMEQQPEQEDSLAGLAAAAAAAAEPEVMHEPVKAEPEGGEGVVGTGELVVDPLVLGEGVGTGADSADACVDAAGATGAVVDAAATMAAPAVDAAGLAASVAAEPVEALPQQPQAGVVDAQPQLHANELQQLHAAAVAAAAAVSSFQQQAEAGAAPAAQMPAADDVSMQDAQLLGSLQELAVLAGIFDNNNGVAAVGASPALI